jgi:signal transduction histidine kinase
VPTDHRTQAASVAVAKTDPARVRQFLANLLSNAITRLEPGAQHGSGIGLAISRRIARLLGGDLELEGAGSGHSAFTLWLPVLPRADPEAGRAGS